MVVFIQNGVVSTQLTVSFQNISTVLTVEVKEIWINWVNKINNEIISNPNINNDEKIVKISRSLNILFNENEKIKEQLINQNIGSWGSIKNMLSISYDIQSDDYKNVTLLDSNNNSQLITTLQKLSNLKEIPSTEVNKITEETANILKDKTLNYVQKQAKIYIVIEKFIVSFPKYKTELYKLEIPNFGPIEAFIDISSKVNFK